MPSTDRKLELQAKDIDVSTVSQPAVCSSGLRFHYINCVNCIVMWRSPRRIIVEIYLSCTGGYYARLICSVACFLLGDSPASEFYMPTLRNTVPSS